MGKIATLPSDDRDVLRSVVQQAQVVLSGRGVPFFWLWKPLAGPQTMALESEAFEVLYGGAAGGGKSDLLLGSARLGHKSVALFRRTYTQLEDSLIPRSREIYGSSRSYNASKHVWSFSDGCRVRFRYLNGEKDVYAHQSAQYDFIGFDELTQFTKRMYEYMLSRCRSTIAGQRCRILAATNPGGEGHEWVVERWAPWLDAGHPNPAKPGELRWFVRHRGDERDTEVPGPEPIADKVTGELLYPRSRTFIPAVLSDNPYLSADNEYRATLQLLPEPYRSQLLHGDWQSGALDDAYQVIPTEWIKAAQARWRSDGFVDRHGVFHPLAGDEAKKEPPIAMSTLGVDVARGGDDKTCLCPRRGQWFGALVKAPGKKTPDGQSVAALIFQFSDVLKAPGVPTMMSPSMAAVQAASSVPVNIDIIGVGASAFDQVKAQVNAVAVNGSERSLERDKSKKLAFMNVRAELWWTLREMLDPETGEDIALPPDPELLGDLRAPRWELRTSGIKIEDKEEIKKRIGRSPDCGDAVTLAAFRRRITAPQEMNFSGFGR